MIISHKHKFIFIKPQKTAGTSVELLLSRICGPDDIITPLGFDPDPNVREKHNAKLPQNYYRSKPLKHWQLNELFWFVTKGRKPNLNYWEHLPADKIKEYVGEKIWNSYLKISIVRNPWDHAVSWYSWQAKYGFGKTIPGEFDQYLTRNYKSLWQFYSINSLYSLDYVIRFENLRNDTKKLFDTLGLSFEKIPITKNKNRTTKTYKEYYKNQLQIDLITERNLNVIKNFDYIF